VYAFTNGNIKTPIKMSIPVLYYLFVRFSL
jgi:hypothetical protein